MKRILLGFVFLLVLSGFAQAAGTGLEVAQGIEVQGFAPNGLYTAVLTTANFTSHNMTNFTAYAIYCTADCPVRFTPTSAYAAYPSVTIPAGSWFIAVRSKATPFVNISGAHQWLQQ